jgi:Asp-tRNA(Asn)/Glu-tRNA(Gln) amidotransferase B subunit
MRFAVDRPARDDADELRAVVLEVLDGRGAARKLRSGKGAVQNFFIGRVAKALGPHPEPTSF